MRIIVIKNNEIINIAYPFPINNPEEGLQEDGTYILYLQELDNLTPEDFIERRYWNGQNLVERPPRPSPFCVWNIGNGNWEVDAVNYSRELRYIRDGLLYKSDWTQLPDAPLTSEQVQQAADYRQELRDITGPVEDNPDAYITIEAAPWPTPPQFLM